MINVRRLGTTSVQFDNFYPSILKIFEGSTPEVEATEEKTRDTLADPVERIIEFFCNKMIRIKELRAKAVISDGHELLFLSDSKYAIKLIAVHFP